MADNEQRLARVCWNEQNWQRPTGLRGKSQSTDTNEKMGMVMKNGCLMAALATSFRLHVA